MPEGLHRPRIRPWGVPTAAAALSCIGALAAAQPPPAPGTKRLAAHPRGDAKITLDGRLLEPVWQKAPVGRDFVERTPTPRIPAPAGHRVRVLYDAEALWIAVRLPLDASLGEKPRALELERDSFDIFNDDAVSLKFDVRLDRRTTLGFVVNAAGTQLDYVALENGASFRREYDAIWTAATHVTPQAWYVEAKIPAAALGAPSVDGVRSFGFNVTRDHSRRAAVYDWSHIPPEFGATSALYYGRLTSIRKLGGGRPLTLIPYGLGRWDSQAAGDVDVGSGSLDAEVGGDVRLRVLQDLWTELTVLPDFAQVDLDDPVVNFDRFPLFFPERRPFFLTGLEVFEFGVPGVAQLFFSRRIGLDDDNDPIPVDAGFKMYGSEGQWRLGALQVFTRGRGDTDPASWSVLRARRNFGETAHLGVLGTLQGAFGAFSAEELPFEPEVSVGTDGSLRLLDRRLIVEGFWAYSRNEVTEGDEALRLEQGMSSRLNVAWLGEVLQPSLSVLWVEDDFDPAIGFVRRSDILQSSAALVFLKRPKADQDLQVQVTLNANNIRSSDGDRNLGNRARAFFALRWRSGWNGSTSITIMEDVVEESFDLFDRRTVEPGRYRGVSGNLFINSPGVRNPTLSVGYEFDTGFFGGTRHGPSIGTGWSIGPHVETSVAAGLTFTRFPDGFSEDAFTFNGRAAWSPSTRLTADAVVQLNTIDQIVTSLGRIRWRYLPGSDMFLVGRSQVGTGGNPEERFDLTLKIQYRADILL